MTVAIIQARMGSTRLPGKVLRPLAGVPMLQHVIERVRRAETVDDVLVATTTSPADDAIVELCERVGCASFRGDEADVLDRYFRAAKSCGATTVIRITSDCPLIDSAVIDEVVHEFQRSGADYASNVIPTRTYPRGLDVEVFSFAALERSWNEATESGSREHVTAHIYRHPERFRIQAVPGAEDESAHRWTVDTAEDYQLAERIYAHFGDHRFGWRDTLTLLGEHPEWSEINAHVEQKTH